jgi:hypothetical protein
MRSARSLAVLGLMGLLLTAGCGAGPNPTAQARLDGHFAGHTTGATTHPGEPSTAHATGPSSAHPVGPSSGHAPVPHPRPAPAPLRAGESRRTIAMPAAYVPKAPTGGTDDYRCFLLDPKLARDEFVTGFDVSPGQASEVHHVILYRVPASLAARARDKDAATPGDGWTCFGGTGLGAQGATLDDAPWIGAWAPGGRERVMAPDVGIPLDRGSLLVLQVHYNLLAGSTPDRTAVTLRLSRSSKLAPLETILLPAPVELPCRPGHTGRLCDRDTAVLDVGGRFGALAPRTVAGLLVLCDGALVPTPGPTQSCTRRINEAATVRAVAGHMHLLGSSLRIVLNAGTSKARTLLDIKVWDFDNQGAVAIAATKIRPGDNITISCTHDQAWRDKLPALRGLPERYVVWGEGTTDEMCLGILSVTRP